MSSDFKTIAVVGAGAIGLYYGARLARAGSDVTFLARSDLDVLRREGVRITAPEEMFTLPADAVKVAATAEDIGPVDLVVITLKATANDQLARLLTPLLKADTAVLNLQNGLGVDEAVAAVAGAGRTLGGLCFVGVNRVAPGEVVCALAGYIVMGEFAGRPTRRTEAVAQVLRAAGLRVDVAPTLLAARWHKLAWNVPFNGLAVVAGGLPCDELLRDAGREARVRALMREIQAIASAEGVPIADEFLEDNVERTRTMAYKPSTMMDYLAGKPLEVEPIWGEPLRRARARGVAVPQLAALYDELKRANKQESPLIFLSEADRFFAGGSSRGARGRSADF